MTRAVHILRARALPAVALLLFACAPSSDDRRGDTTQPAATPPAAAETPTPVESPPASKARTITPEGFGPLRIGMTVAEAREATGKPIGVDDPGADCKQMPLDQGSRAVVLMFVNGKLARLDVNDKSVSTDKGARVGDSESRISELYGSQVTVKPHKYSNGHYLVVTPSGAGESGNRLVFETDGQMVTNYRTGSVPQVEWVEGCS